MPIHEAKTYEAWCDQCGRRTQYTAANRTDIEGGWTVKLGKTLAVGDVLITSDGSDAVLARAGMTYAIPPKR